MSDSDRIRQEQRDEIARRNRESERKDPFKVADEQKRRREARERREGSERRSNDVEKSDGRGNEGSHIPNPRRTRKDIERELTQE